MLQILTLKCNNADFLGLTISWTMYVLNVFAGALAVYWVTLSEFSDNPHILGCVENFSSVGGLGSTLTI